MANEKIFLKNPPKFVYHKFNFILTSFQKHISSIIGEEELKRLIGVNSEDLPGCHHVGKPNHARELGFLLM